MDIKEIIIKFLAFLWGLVVIGYPVAILSLLILIFMRVNKLQKGNCEGVPKFTGGSSYTKTLTIPLINKTVTGNVIFNLDNTFTLDAEISNSKYSYPNNKWIYDENNCLLNIVLDPSLESDLKSYATINNVVNINRDGSLLVDGNVLGILPIQVSIQKNN